MKPPRQNDLFYSATELNVAVMATEDLAQLAEILAAENRRPGGARPNYVKRIRHRIGAVARLHELRRVDGE